MWDKKYRPQQFADVLGQQGAIAVLKARLKDGSAWNKSYLFAGGHGMGKTTLGRIMARAMLCQQLNPDDPDPCNVCDNCRLFLSGGSQAFQERDAASQGKIDHIREIVDTLPFTVLDAKKRIYLFDECHRMSKDAQDVLLKPIEEKTMVGMFCTTEPEKVRGPIRSRCEEHMMRRVTREEILVWVKRVLEAEKVSHEDEGVLTVIDYTGGHLRDVLNQLEMIAQGGEISLERVRDQLNLSLVSVYYEILLKVPVDLQGALALLDKVRERVTAEEAASGLAEAAMNSFRIANQMAADFAFTDRELAVQVSALYGEQTVKVTEHFLRSRHITYVGLTCDLASLSHQLRVGGGVAAAPQPLPMVFAPVVQVVQASAPAQTPSTSTQAAPAPAPSTPIPSPSSPAPAPTQAPQAAAAPKGKSVQELMKPGHIPTSFVGEAAVSLTDHDAQVVASRAVKTGKVPMNPADRSERDDLTPISPEAWRHTFKGRIDRLGGRTRG